MTVHIQTFRVIHVIFSLFQFNLNASCDFTVYFDKINSLKELSDLHLCSVEHVCLPQHFLLAHERQSS